MTKVSQLSLQICSFSLTVFPVCTCNVFKTISIQLSVVIYLVLGLVFTNIAEGTKNSKVYLTLSFT